jgi:hypothetical protein
MPILSIALIIKLSVAVILIISMIVVFMMFIHDHALWKTKKDIDFAELDRMLNETDNKILVNKYLHKYRADRRWYENRMVKETVAIALIMIGMFTDAVFIFFVK